MRYLSWACSIVLHIALLMLLIHSVTLEPFDVQQFMELDLTEIEAPADEPDIIQPVPMPPPAPEMEPSPLPPEASVAPMPLPMDKTVVLDDSPPPPPEPAEALEPEPALEPDVVEISPVKTEEKKLPRNVRVRKDFVVHRGHEARFGRTMLADYYSYESTEFSGHFTTKDNRTISIIDARNTKYGRFLIYDSKNKTLRRLKQALGKYVYTIGPSLDADEPVIGTVTFLAKNDRIERFILQTDDDRIAHFPRKVHVREADVSFPTPDGEMTGQISLPPSGEGHPGFVFVHGNLCVDPDMVRGFTRSLSMEGLASLAFQPHGCESEVETGEPEPAQDGHLAADVAAALDYLSARPQTQGGRLGLWGNGPGAPVAVQAALSPTQVKPAFLVCLLNDTVSPTEIPDTKTLSKLNLPTLWLVTGRDTGKWRPLIRSLEKLRDKQKRPFTIILAPLKASQEVLKAQGDQSGWVEQVTEKHSGLAVSWIRSFGK